MPFNQATLPPKLIDQFFYSHIFQKFLMTDQGEQNHRPVKPQDPRFGTSQNPQGRPLQHKFEIQITSKKRKEVISIESSSQRVHSQEMRSLKSSRSNSPAQSKSPKPKKTTFKCMLCRGTGRKNEMKTCSSCRLFSHIQCLDQNEMKKKYVCDKCKAAQMEESKMQKKMKKQEEKIQTEKAAQKRIEKQKKKDESNKTLEKFKVKYPYYIYDEKIRFPIEDKLLFIYRDYFQPSENRPVPTDHPVIPSELVGDFLEFENFIVGFSKEFDDDYHNGEYRKSVLYTIMNCRGSDKIFERLLGAIIKIYLKDIFERNKTQNVKILNDNSFFILLGTINEANELTAEFVAFISAEIIRNLSNVPSMKAAFTNFVFPEELNLQTKLQTLISLIQGLSEVDGFHEMVGRKSEKIAEMTKDKQDFVTKLKKNEADALSNKQKLKQILGKNQHKPGAEEKDVEIVSEQKSVKEIQKTKKKTQKMAIDGEHSDRIIKEFKSKIVKIARMIPFTVSEVMFLGNDRNKSSFYFYLREPHRLYVRYHHYLLDESEHFKIYEGKEKIQQVLKSLNTKGIHEKHLYESINYLIKQDVLRNLTSEEEMRQFGTSSVEPMDDVVMVQDQEGYRKKIISDIMEIEDKFSTYLAIKNCRWSPEEKRKEWKVKFPQINDVQEMKESVRSLQESFLFVEVIREQQQQRVEQSDSNNEDRSVNFMIPERQTSRRKKPIRIWGINSEKIKKFWMEYLETCINYTGVWISIFIFRKYVEKYLDKKMEHIREQEKRQNMERQREHREKKLREQRDKEKQQRNLDRLRSRDKGRLILRKSPSSNNDPIEVSNSEGVKTRRRLRPSTTRLRNKPLTLDSDEDQQEGEMEEQSVNEDECALCEEVGDVICCDTCPKVFHLECLKIKEIPEGEWSCVECLQKLANERQTRSKARRISK